MHLCMQDDHIDPKIVGLALADMAGLPSSINTINILAHSKQPSLSGGLNLL
jgi:hypothetical protein